jgi:excisionase family DNA binding protein
MTIKEAAVRLRISAATVYKLCERGQLRHVRLSTHAIRIVEQDLAEFIWARRRA